VALCADPATGAGAQCHACLEHAHSLRSLKVQMITALVATPARFVNPAATAELG